MYWEYDRDGLQRQAARWGRWKAVNAPSEMVGGAGAVAAADKLK